MVNVQTTARFTYKLIAISIIMSMVLSDITSPVNYPSIKYSNIHLEVTYITNSGVVRKYFDFTQQNVLVTILNSKVSVTVSGRLLVVKSSDAMSTNGTIASRMSMRNGACSKITTISEVPWVALVLRGGKCSIKEKLNFVLRKSNASAAIILDNSLSKNIDRYEFNNRIGLRLNELLIPISELLNETILINVTIVVNNFFIDGFISRTSVLFVSISFILLMVISLTWLIYYYVQRLRYIHAKERLSRRLASAAKKALDKIPLKVLSVYDEEVSNDFDQCAICIDSYNVGETIRILPCKHIFHKVCIDSWLIEQRSCPMCKVDILKACGVLNVSSSRKTSLVNQGFWLGTATAAFLEAGLNREESVALGSQPSSRWRRGHSTFLQRYRDRHGLHHCHRSGHRRDHFHKISRHFQEQRCANNSSKSLLSKVTAIRPFSVQERSDSISEYGNLAANQKPPFLFISIPKDKDRPRNRQIECKSTNVHNNSSMGLVHEVCDCNMDNTNGDYDVFDRVQNNSTRTSTDCSCETCSDCPLSDTGAGHCVPHRFDHSTGICNLLKCCLTSNTATLNHIPQHVVSGVYCCNPCDSDRSTKCSYCINTSSSVTKTRSSKSICSNFTSNLNNSQFFHSNPSALYHRPYNIRRSHNVKSHQSMIFVKNLDPIGTIDAYTKSSISDDFDYELDAGSNSIEFGVPAVKLTVLPPQVQCHQGPHSTVCTYTTEEPMRDDTVNDATMLTNENDSR